MDEMRSFVLAASELGLQAELWRGLTVWDKSGVAAADGWPLLEAERDLPDSCYGALLDKVARPQYPETLYPAILHYCQVRVVGEVIRSVME